MRTILFLDVHGVLSCGSCDDDSCGHLPNLRRIVDSLGCQIVLTSSIRFDRQSTATLRRLFAEHGIPASFELTPDLHAARWQEIRKWTEDHDAAGDRLVIIDDGEDADLATHAPGTYRCHFFLSDFRSGLDEALTEAVLELAGET